MEAASIAHEHHGPPPAHRSSRVHAPLLGMLLFIMSEVMIFGAFFTAYFFIRIANHNPWPAHGTTLPEAVAGINTAILVSSSVTIAYLVASEPVPAVVGIAMSGKPGSFWSCGAL